MSTRRSLLRKAFPIQQCAQISEFASHVVLGKHGAAAFEVKVSNLDIKVENKAGLHGAEGQMRQTRQLLCSDFVFRRMELQFVRLPSKSTQKAARLRPGCAW